MNIDWENPDVRPAPLVCPACGKSADDWEWDSVDEEWVFTSEWWVDELDDSLPLHGYTCSRKCYRKRKNERDQL